MNKSGRGACPRWLMRGRAGEGGLAVRAFEKDELSGRRKSSFPKRVANQSVRIEINLPVVLVVRVRTHRQRCEGLASSYWSPLLFVIFVHFVATPV